MFFSGLLGGALGYIVAAPFFMASRIAQAEVGVLASDGLLATGVRKGLPPTAGVVAEACLTVACSVAQPQQAVEGNSLMKAVNVLEEHKGLSGRARHLRRASLRIGQVQDPKILCWRSNLTRERDRLCSR